MELLLWLFVGKSILIKEMFGGNLDLGGNLSALKYIYVSTKVDT